MVTVRILDHVAHPSDYEDGAVILDILLPHLHAGVSVDVSFDGVTAVPSSFINAAFVPLLQTMPMEQIRKQLHFTHSTRFINSLIRDRFEFVSQALAAEGTH